MEVDHQKKNFICRFCNKKFPCGKSLGGHIRIHLSGSSATAASVDDQEVKLNISKSLLANNTATGNGNNNNNKRIISSGSEAGGQSGYVLRENPKKTNRFEVDSFRSISRPEKVCKECGKGFQSLKALCGHMACHSKTCFEEEESDQKHKELVMDSLSDTETSSTPSKRSRSKRMRYKTIGAYTTSSLSLPNGSLSSASSDIEQEQEELAICLMMLSRDSGFKGFFSSVADSSDNNSVVLEAKSSSTKMRISVNSGVNCGYNGNEFLEMKKAKQREGIPIENDNSENSDSGYFRNGPKKVESDVSAHGFNQNDEFKNDKVKFGSGFNKGFDAETGKRLSRFRRIKAELGKDLIEEDGYDQAERGSMKYCLQKKGKHNSCDPEFISCNAEELGKYFSPTGDRINGCSYSLYESGQNCIDNDYASSLPPSSKKIQSCKGKKPMEQKFSNAEKKLGSKRGKIHECPFCSKVFRSGQALGGHKRSHFVGGADDRTLVIEQELREISMPRLFDLNLPVPMEEEANGFMSW